MYEWNKYGVKEIFFLKKKGIWKIILFILGGNIKVNEYLHHWYQEGGNKKHEKKEKKID